MAVPYTLNSNLAPRIYEGGGPQGRGESAYLHSKYAKMPPPTSLALGHLPHLGCAQTGEAFLRKKWGCCKYLQHPPFYTISVCAGAGSSSGWVMASKAST